MVELTDEIMTTKALDEGRCAVALFLDQGKADETVNHSILLSKHDLYGVYDTM